MYAQGKPTSLSIKNYCVLALFETLSPHPVSLRLWKYAPSPRSLSKQKGLITDIVMVILQAMGYGPVAG